MSDASSTVNMDTGQGSFGQVLLITAVATIGGFLFGFDSIAFDPSTLYGILTLGIDRSSISG